MRERHFDAEYMARELAGRPDLRGRKVHHLGWPAKYDQVFDVQYAGWDDEWLVITAEGKEWCRASGRELEPYLVKEEAKQ